MWKSIEAGQSAVARPDSDSRMIRRDRHTTFDGKRRDRGSITAARQNALRDCDVVLGEITAGGRKGAGERKGRIVMMVKVTMMLDGLDCCYSMHSRTAPRRGAVAKPLVLLFCQSIEQITVQYSGQRVGSTVSVLSVWALAEVVCTGAEPHRAGVTNSASYCTVQ
ncbi:hypothetical protein BCV70DRAFT_6115 [Testicularia cyperi]|uniref:Uncharacterized protein n=1 Tax=Testicularia cyperi TaxID=1882483 RepID=A0A317XZJ1_9BASI|nr:hypothetical protein BCV70DRAFT_6115 [Testicularia cyperi]